MSKEHRLTISMCMLMLGAYCIVYALEFNSTLHGILAAVNWTLAAVICEGGKSMNAEMRK